MAFNQKYAQLQSTTLAGAGAAIGDTSIVLTSFKSIDGVNLAMTDFGDIGYATIEPNSRESEEQVSFTGITQNVNGTATLTGIKTVGMLTPHTETSGLAKSHAGGVKFVVSNTSAFHQSIIDYVDGIAIAGAPDSSTSTKGIVKMSVAPAVSTSPIAVGDNDPRLSSSSIFTAIAPLIYPVGSLYMATVSTNPNTLLGFGTWAAWGQGRVPVGIGAATVIATFASRSSNVITVTGLSNTASNEFQTGQAVLYSAPSGAMTGLTHNTTYYLVRTGNLTFSLASSLANAQNGTVISLSSDGTGTQTFTLTLTTRTAGETGGEERHAMSLDELLAHTHSVYTSSPPNVGGASSNVRADNTAGNSGSKGGNQAMNNMQPFITCYMWQRTA
jgi:hypothetical protein